MVFANFFLLAFLSSAPFLTGEKLHYTVSWSGIKAGEMTLRVERDQDILFIEQETWSTGFFHAIFPMRDRFQSFVDIPSSRSLLFVKDIQEKKKEKYSTIFFLWDENVSYYNHRLYPLPDRAMDTLSSIFLLRTELDHLPVDIAVHDRGKTYVLRILESARETLRISGTRIPTLRVEPVLITGKKDEKAEMILWFSTSPDHVPVRLRFKAAIGSLTATLDPVCE